MKRIFMSLAAACLIFSAASGNMKANNEISGKPVLTVFTNFHNGLGDKDNDRGFDLDRTYLGYQFDLGSGFSGKAVMDIGSSGVDGSSIERIAYIKNAFLTYKNAGFSLSGGLVGNIEFDLQEKFWGRRYLYKVFDDENGFGSSADMGVIASYSFAKAVFVDAAVTNGEGFKKLNSDKGMRFGAGITVNPTKNLVLRLYGDTYQKPESSNGKAQNSFSAFAGWKSEKFSLGAEYNMLQNKKFAKDKNLNGFSIYADANLVQKLNAFARYDQLGSKDDFNTATDGSTTILGLEYVPNKNVKLAPNFRMKNPKTDGAKNINYVYLNLYFGL